MTEASTFLASAVSIIVTAPTSYGFVIYADLANPFFPTQPSFGDDGFVKQTKKKSECRLVFSCSPSRSSDATSSAVTGTEPVHADGDSLLRFTEIYVCFMTWKCSSLSGLERWLPGPNKDLPAILIFMGNNLALLTAQY